MLRFYVSRIAILISILCFSSWALADERPTPFDQGKISVSGGLGFQSADGDNFVVLGLGAGYFVLKGLQLELTTAAWIGYEPFVATVTPGARYILWPLPMVHPYVGAFYRYWYIADGIDDQQSVGGRLGLTTVQRYITLNAGVVVEKVITDCDDCNDIYPEVSLSFSF